MKVMGLDTSTTATGYAILEDDKIIESGVIKPPKKLDSIQRIICIDDEIQKIYKKHKPEFVVIEEMVSFRNANAMRVLIGLIYHLVIEFTKKDILVVLARPSSWRKAANVKGRTREEYKKSAIEHIKNKYNKIVSDDEADSIGLAEYGLSLEIEEE